MGQLSFLFWKPQITKEAAPPGGRDPKLGRMSYPNAPPVLVIELTQRLHAFFNHLDNRRYAEVLELFLPQGRWLRQGHWLEGREAILAALNARPASIKVRHVISNVVVSQVTAAEAHVEACMTAYRQLAGESASLFRINLVTNVFLLETGAWMLAEQQLLPEFDFSSAA